MSRCHHKNYQNRQFLGPHFRGGNPKFWTPIFEFGWSLVTCESGFQKKNTSKYNDLPCIRMRPYYKEQVATAAVVKQLSLGSVSLNVHLYRHAAKSVSLNSTRQFNIWHHAFWFDILSPMMFLFQLFEVAFQHFLLFIGNVARFF